LARLAESCQGIGRALPWQVGKLETWLNDALRESAFKEALLRIGVNWETKISGSFVSMIREFQAYPEDWYKEGVAVKTAVTRRWTLKAQDSQIKSSQYASGVMAFLDKGQAPVHELLFLGQGGTVAEGSVSNIFIVKEKRLLTPHAASGILRGVTRNFVVYLAKQRGIQVAETFLTRHEIYSAEECFMTNTSSEVLPVVEVDARKIGDGGPGPMTRGLRADFRNYVEVFRKNGQN